MKNPRFSQATLDFLALAQKQKKVEWLEKHQDDYQNFVVSPMKALAEQVSAVLELEFKSYKFKKRNIGNIKRPADRAQDKGPFIDFLTFSADRDSGSRYEDLPSLYFMLSPREGEIFSAGGLYMSSHSQTKKIRQWIDLKPEALLDLFKDKNFSKLYKNLGDEHKLKTKPRDYPMDHPRIEWLKLTGFYVSRAIPKKELFSGSFAEILIRDWKEAMRFNNLLDDWIQRSPGQASQKVSEKSSFGLHAYDWDD
jgi:uncharacterized protein (TIGR02453 family)